MHPSRLHYFPLSGPFMAALFVLVIVVIALIELRILTYAYEKIGINRRFVWALLLLSLIGSYINIPVAELPPEKVLSDQEITFFGIHYIVPMVEEWPGTIIAVNVGGAVIPTLLSLYLLIKNRLHLSALAGVAIVTIIVHLLARPVPGVGISIPIFIPPLVAAA